MLQLETIWLLNFLGFSTSPNSLHGRVIGYLRDIHCSLLCINITHATAGRENRTLGILELEGSALWHKEHDRTAQACTVYLAYCAALQHLSIYSIALLHGGLACES